ncbi:hypothetical protein [Nakamurella leprariae]|uniref:Uncharacterized protein n=1 Tax=Nakamurella leprariae TaxID=2803911 RepID=A0A938YK44_9ACTN|nr:hypothetical protein [Nakamurella leprariae]MBM9469634.1 hypothetical protein [Nakamurella leprariae]
MSGSQDALPSVADNAKDRRHGRRWREVGVTIGALAVTACLVYVFIGVLSMLAPVSGPPTDPPALPDGLRVIDSDSGCASGGCTRSWTIGGSPGMTADEIVRALDQPESDCGHRGSFDWGRRCTGVGRVGDTVDGTVVLWVEDRDPGK